MYVHIELHNKREKLLIHELKIITIYQKLYVIYYNRKTHLTNFFYECKNMYDLEGFVLFEFGEIIKDRIDLGKDMFVSKVVIHLHYFFLRIMLVTFQVKRIVRIITLNLERVHWTAYKEKLF